ncbi:family 43 glycosylhydrolase [Parabacteroides pacaensis]|uniref:family 43 glycosylhydrolase n=1 Tax=Parabacteroides pacaensis TaxID=2086575 RepID=UPI000D0E7C17|nr:family 43 glycosylhydrolase [Parabacteroides pacaensis]
MKKILFSFLAWTVFVSIVWGQSQATFTNPVIHGDVADPTILRIGKTYYAAGTSSEWAPFYPLFTSTDLINWKQAGHIFDEQPEWTRSSFWAPELFYHNKKIYAYYTARRKKDGVSYIGVATSSDPAKGFKDHGIVVEFGKEAIDAFVLEDQGQLYITWKAYGLDNRPIELLASKLSADGLRLEGEPFSLLRDDERRGMEGQHWFKKGDYYYILYAVNGCCGPQSDYAVSIARSKNLQGPYEKYKGNPILHGGGKVQSCGHGTITTTPDGRMFYLCHAYLSGADFYQGRQPILQELVMGDDQWFRFATGEVATLQQPLPFPHTKQQPVKDFEDRFNGKKLNLAWTWNYVYSSIDTRLKNGTLFLSGTPKQEYQTGTALCLRPVKANYTVVTQVVNRNNSFKGITMYGDDRNLMALGCQGNDLILKLVNKGKEYIVYRETLDALSKQTSPVPSVYLKMKVTEGCRCTFFYSPDGKEWSEIEDTRPEHSPGSLTQWDRVARPGLLHCGKKDEPGAFSFFNMHLN